ncbi:MAG: RsmG family class I SAM-dependent methyltransferase, partial [Actinomycetota bacterium]
MGRRASARARSRPARWSSAATDPPRENHENTPDQGKLAAYAALVRTWANRLDLVAPGDLDRFEERHIADSLRLLPLLERLPEGPCVDVGSGAGLPGIPLA